MIEAGKLRYQLELQRKTFQADEGGGGEGVFQTYSSVWGDIRQSSSREIEVAAQRQIEQSHTIEIRYSTVILPQDRVKYDDRIFAIVGMQDVEERKRRMILQCREIKSQTEERG